MSCSSAVPVLVTRPEVGRVQRDPRTQLLALYDEAGFPDVSGRRLVERRIELGRGELSCDRGVLLDRGQATTFFSASLVMDHGSALIDAIPPMLRRSTPRPSWPPGADEEVEPMPPPPVVVVDLDLPVTVLALPWLGARDRAQGDPCGPPPSDASAELDALVRARWATMRGLPALAEQIFAPTETDVSRIERQLRTEMAAILHAEAGRSMLGWLPRLEVAQLLRRAAEVSSRPSDTKWWQADAHRLSIPHQLEWGDEPDAIASLLPEQGVSPTGRLGASVVALDGASWNPRTHLRDPIGELLALDMPGARRLVGRLGDETWTRSDCDGRYASWPCSVGAASRIGLETFAARTFANDDQVRQWWAEVEGMTEADMLRTALDGPRFLDAADRLTTVVGPRVIEDLTSVLQPGEAALVAEAVSRAASRYEVAIRDDAPLRDRYLRELDDLGRVVAPMWLPEAVEGRLVVDPEGTLDRLAARFDYAGASETFEHETRVDLGALWADVFQLAVVRSHRAMLGDLVRAVEVPREDELAAVAWSVVGHACLESHVAEALGAPSVDLACPPTVRAAAIRGLRRRLAAEATPTRWEPPMQWEYVEELAELLGVEAPRFTDGDPTVLQIQRLRRLVPSLRPPVLPRARGPSDRIVAVLVHGEAEREAATRWVTRWHERTIADVQPLVDDFEAFAIGREDEFAWTLVAARWAGRGIVLYVEADPGGSLEFEVQYRDGREAIVAPLSGSGSHLLRPVWDRWHTDDPPDVTEIAVRIPGS